MGSPESLTVKPESGKGPNGTLNPPVGLTWTPPATDGGSTYTWSPPLYFDTDILRAPANITVGFSLAPKDYHFKKYIVELVSDPDEKMVHKCVIDTLDDYSCLGIYYQRVPEDAKTVTHTFHNLAPATYNVLIEPVDPDSQNTDRCLCFERTSDTHKICRLCLTTKSSDIVVTGESTRHDTGTILAVVCGSTLVFSVVVFVILVIICRGRQNAARHQVSVHGMTSQTLSSPRNGKCPLLVLPKKNVYLLYAEDHKDHLNVITCLAVYLKEQCYCDVFYLPWFKGAFQAIGTYQWIISHIDEADYVIVISSEAAFKLLDARNTNTSLKTEDEGPEGDIFSPAITHVRTKSLEPDFYRKTILVYFDYTSEDFVLKEVSPGVHYKLPKHFKDFLCHIHEVDVFDQTGRHPDIEAMGNLLSSRRGQAFQEAIIKARHFQKSDPLWFDRRFRRQDSSYRSKEDLEVGDSVSMKAQTADVDPLISVDGERIVGRTWINRSST
ncbi:interleukin-17 receptor D-like [Haliotis asinina]|uniref:interleukin-17 receptor D-like n=1 Tax=Haliotis asinina TaxID=109174 RepID=UPI003532262B